MLAKTKILPVTVKEEMSMSFISYAMAVNVSRAIPDVRDGLKPVHRRILFAMHDLNNTYDKPTKKCARIVGEVMGKYHPHGDSSVYFALVRMAQDFSINVPLIQGQGNFGTVDGDPPAAQRYTEARLSKIASEMLRDIDKETVDFYPNFDDTLTQPVVLPCHFPNLLINGSEGIAVGMATSIPPHNMREVIQGTIALIDDPDITVDELMEYIPAPDYPTGGMVLGRSAIRQAYRTGHGGVVIRSKANIEEHNGREEIVVTEIPYQVNKSNLIKAIVDQVKDKKIEGISNIREESDRFGMRLVIEVKRDANAQVVLNTLYKQTNLQVSTGINFLALVRGKPLVLNLKQILEEYILHQIDIIERRTRFNLRKAAERCHIVEGLVVAVANIDEVVHIIKNSRERSEAANALMERFSLSEKQVNAILDMRLSSLTGLQIEKLQGELEQLRLTIIDLEDILAKPERVKAIIKDDLQHNADAYGEERKSEISYDESEINIEDLIVQEDVVISMTYQNYIKRMAVTEYRSQNRGGTGVTAHKLKDEDFVSNVFVCNTHEDLLFFSNKGKAYSIRAYMVPEASKTAKGRAMVNVLPLEAGEKITAFLSAKKYDEGYIVMCTKKGLIRKSALSEFQVVRSNGKIAITLLDDDEVIGVEKTEGNSDIIVASKKGKSIRFSEKDVRRTGRGSQGVRSMKLDEDDYIVDMGVINDENAVITISENGYGKITDIAEYRCQNRAGKGIKAGNFTEKTGLLVNMKLVRKEEDLIIIADNGTMIRIRAEQVSKIGRNTQGVTIMKLRNGGKVVAMARTPHDDNAEFDQVDIDEEALRQANEEAANAPEEVVETQDEKTEE
ncbi:MAG TPA: DNA gyrase subunit A [Clostridia bacterium]|nr:DNA gyrase subunit A [Clostridia bacterium]